MTFAAAEHDQVAVLLARVAQYFALRAAGLDTDRLRAATPSSMASAAILLRARVMI